MGCLKNVKSYNQKLLNNFFEIKALWCECMFCIFFFRKPISLFKNGQKKCPKSKSQNYFWEKNDEN